MATTVGQHSVSAFTSPSNGDALDAAVVKGNDNTLRSAYVDHDADTGIHLQSSTLASRPAAGVVGRKWMTTDAGSVKVWYDNGSTWEEISVSAPASLSTITVTGNTRLAETSGNVGVGTASPAASAKLHSVVSDGTYSAAFSGTTKGIRLEHNATDSRVTGVDNTLVGSYQPLGLDGSKINIYAGNTQRWEVSSAGHVVPFANNQYDIGAVGTTVRHGYFSNVTGGSVSFTSLTGSGQANLQDNTLLRAVIRDYGETRTTPTISGGTLTLNLENGNVFGVSLNANITTLTIQNPPASGTAGSFTLALTADGTARTITWGSAVKWAGGTSPTLTSTNGKIDVFVFFTWDAGLNWYGFVSGQNL